LCNLRISFALTLYHSKLSQIAEYKSRPRESKAAGDSEYDAPEESPRPQLAQHPAVASMVPTARSTGSSAPVLSAAPQFAPPIASGRGVGSTPPSQPPVAASACVILPSTDE
jgi:hypothetical protein